mmetsp:Transcript_25452/g.37526  ORF Transcript_25452/g.37526 Transcript_25452/m.37526 type:complete len:274 (-) Transcript_25452:146-967(-)|eukprot:CAMPEP_0185025522 /NCGR_PEP_ID=MMETSP1103-20130426/8444_1 /TAXON_ID=36769 /ORGANISM="Paraphysomonas bandaiensis, Strain Caron Lab Isolate" /LENGTH=273 /DNA_ID=CAMNT_0027558735 /DNA_START=76 /DNA_END=897 /DNA_ORIENTATION=-
MTLSYEEALGTLCSMFESWDRETLAAIFESNGYHVERTIETILAMEQPELQASEPEVDHSDTGALIDMDDMGVDFGQQYSQQRAPAEFAPQDKNNGHRGIACTLPDDFLRPPGRTLDKQTMRDEQLALMLQNELFQREVEQALGHHPFSDAYTSRREGSGQRMNRTQQQAEGIPDMGILKMLNEMGEGMKSQLNQLAIKFNSSISGTGAQEDELGGTETRPLTARDYEEEDDDEEGPLISSTSSSAATRRAVSSSSGAAVRRTQAVGGGKKDK